VQFGGDEIVQAKAGAGSATTCMAYAGFRYGLLSPIARMRRLTS
jgi:malate/lactate dehydrogenase